MKKDIETGKKSNQCRYFEEKLFDRLVIERIIKENTKENQGEKQRVISELEEGEKRLYYIRDLLASQQLGVKDYNEMKEDYDSRINRLNLKLSALNED